MSNEPSEEDLEDLIATEAELMQDADYAATAQRLLEERLPTAILEIARLGKEAQAERVKLDANKYLVDRVLGSTTKVLPEQDDESDPLKRLLKKAGYGDS